LERNVKKFENKVAVITGAASGIGRALAQRCAQEKMKIVLADIEEKALLAAESELKADGAQVIAILTDIAKHEDVKALAQETINAYQHIDLLFNNAGVAAGAAIWESTLNDCKWVIDVNLWGVIHSIREFVPLMMQQDIPCHIVNTSSIAGLTTYHPSALYQLTKHGIVAISEQLHHDLAIRGANIKVSVLCPGFVNTNIMDAERNRPAEYVNQLDERKTADADDMEDAFLQMIKNGMPPTEVATRVFQAIVEEKFYVFTHPELNMLIQARMEDILHGRNPSLPPAPQ
jgi:NAD(P)-dependent dehydrogenase (short-subunit alcohol dehydrogenase family)